jgi:hypothetical protein
VDDLTAFLRGRLDEREDGLRKLVEKTATDSYSALEMSLHAEISILASAQPPPQSVPAAEHAAWQHMLADVDAKRRIIDEHAPRTVTITDYEQYAPGVVICSKCSYPHGDAISADEYTAHPCRTLRLLALPYAGHPDNREEWRP